MALGRAPRGTARTTQGKTGLPIEALTPLCPLEKVFLSEAVTRSSPGEVAVNYSTMYFCK